LSRTKTGINLPVLYASAVQQDFIPTFAFNGSRLANTASFGTNNAPFYNYNTTIAWIDNLSKVWHQHTLKAGIYIQHSRKDQTSFANANGSYDFSDDASNIPVCMAKRYDNISIIVECRRESCVRALDIYPRSTAGTRPGSSRTMSSVSQSHCASSSALRTPMETRVSTW
jgi:hypothetical protein